MRCLYAWNRRQEDEPGIDKGKERTEAESIEVVHKDHNNNSAYYIALKMMSDVSRRKS